MWSGNLLLNQYSSDSASLIAVDLRVDESLPARGWAACVLASARCNAEWPWGEEALNYSLCPSSRGRWGVASTGQ